MGKGIVLCGFMGCGKTTLGKPLAKQLKYEFIDTDQMIIDFTGKTIPQIFAEGGEGLFRDIEHKIAQQICKAENTVVSTGGGLMTFQRNRELFQNNSIVVYIKADFETCYKRINTKDRPIVQKNTKEQLREIYKERISSYEKAATITIVNRGKVSEMVDCIEKKLNTIN